ncbi:MAG TPA: MBL fold metallo-hydrolase, partial [Gammaproteobacteria bacterium]|nr:MBL fold metallo-hydrolase [Gammaproteobacteria bacterium]
SSHQSFSIGSIHIEPVPVPHDAREPSQFVFTARDEKRLGLLTDIGHVTPHVRERYQACDALLVECNHDVEMLANGPYPQRLKQRVAGIQGHLSNAQAADLLQSVKTDRLAHVVLNHISEKNNLPSLALDAAREALGEWQGELQVADQQNGVDWIEIA